ncbi:MAG: Asp-tRNA(Asn)/Glu-tRNA(Gln) amidotransferase subunit GatC [Gemmatimonadaceae bacterium]
MARGVRESDVRHVASLARVGLEPGRIEQLVRELNGILEHMDVLARVDTSGIQPFVAQGLDAMPLRSDADGTSTPLSEPLATMAPEMRDGFFLVPRLATHEDDGERSA